jgi:transposase-like protein
MWSAVPNARLSGEDLAMRKRTFERLMDLMARATPAQLKVAENRLSELAAASAALHLAEEHLTRSPSCPHCGRVDFKRWGRTPSGMQRYRCAGCERTFIALTGTRFARLHKKARLLENARLMREFVSVRKAARSLDVHRNTAYRYRQLMMPLLTRHQPSSLEGVTEADEMFFRRSYKGQKAGLPRAAHKRGSPAKKRGLSVEQVPVLTALSRGSKESLIEVLPGPVNAAVLESILRPALKRDAVLCTDSASAYLSAGKAMGVLVRQVPRGSHKLGPYHIQNANALHSRVKSRMRGFRGVATRHLPAYLAWVRFFDRDNSNEAARALLLEAFETRATSK